MKLYLDDDSASSLLAQLLIQAGHDVVMPASLQLEGAEDPVHLTCAIREDRALLTGNHADFHALHDLIAQAQGHHPGILIVRRDNDPRRDMTPRGIVVSFKKKPCGFRDCHSRSTGHPQSLAVRVGKRRGADHIGALTLRAFRWNERAMEWVPPPEAARAIARIQSALRP